MVRSQISVTTYAFHEDVRQHMNDVCDISRIKIFVFNKRICSVSLSMLCLPKYLLLFFSKFIVNFWATYIRAYIHKYSKSEQMVNNMKFSQNIVNNKRAHNYLKKRVIK